MLLLFLSLILLYVRSKASATFLPYALLGEGTNDLDGEAGLVYYCLFEVRFFYIAFYIERT